MTSNAQPSNAQPMTAVECVARVIVTLGNYGDSESVDIARAILATHRTLTSEASTLAARVNDDPSMISDDDWSFFADSVMYGLVCWEDHN
jgi:hypothetical protein